MELTISGSLLEIETMLSRFKTEPPPIPVVPVKKDPPILQPEQVKEVQETITKVIKLPPILETKIERIDPVKKEMEVIREVKGKVFSKKNKSKVVEITFADSGILYKKFISCSAASHYFGKTNLNANLRDKYRFEYNGIWFNIKYQI